MRKDFAKRRTYRKPKESCRNRRARLMGAEGVITSRDIAALFKRYGRICLCCGSKFKIQIDHVIPLSRGGTNWPDNIQPLCKSCNCKKGTKTIDYRGNKWPNGL